MHKSGLHWSTLLPACIGFCFSSVDAAVPERIISTTPHATEMVAALAVDKLVAVDSASDYPLQVKKLPKLGAYPVLGLEPILIYRPDLVVIWGDSNQSALKDKLMQRGVQVFSSQPQSPRDVASDLRRLGAILQQPERAEKLAREQEQRYAVLQAHYSKLRPVKVYLQVSENPLMSISGRSFLGQALRDCGAINAFDASAQAAPQVSVEAVLAFGPEIMINTGPVSGLHYWQRYAKLPAVAHGRLYALESDALMRPGPRLIEGIEVLCKLIDQARTQSKNTLE